MKTNLPIPETTDSAEATNIYFDTYGKPDLPVSADEASSTISFFESRGFSKSAASATASTILNQAKINGTPVFQLLDTLKGLSSIQLSAVVAEILNNNRKPTSTLGYRLNTINKTEITRNIAP